MARETPDGRQTGSSDDDGRSPDSRGTESLARDHGGVTTTTVVDNDDPEELGRVKLRNTWEDGGEPIWARIAAPMAGKEFGTYYLPEKDDEVLVAFGRRGEPYVLGGLWSQRSPPPVENEGDNDVRAIKSRSGHEITLDDAKGAEQVTVETSGGHTVTLDDESGSEKIAIQDSSGDNRIELDATTGTVTIEAQQTLRLSAPEVDVDGKSKVDIDSKGRVDVSGKGKLNLSSKGRLNVQSSGVAKVEASGPLTLKGALIQLN